MAAVTTSNPADFANRVQTYFTPELLKALLYHLVLAKYGWTQKFPAIGTTIRFFRPRGANTTGVAAIAEGVTPTTLSEVAVGYVDVPLSQRGALATVTDLVQAIDLLNTVQQYVKSMGADAALDLDTVIRNALVTALNDSNATYTGAFFERFAGTVNTGVSSTDFATFNALTAANAQMTRARHLVNLTQLRASRVPLIEGKYAVLVPPQVMLDVRKDVDWVSAATRMADGSIFKNDEIELDGGVFIPHDNPWREGATYKTYSASGANFGVLYLGDGAFGTPQLDNNKAGGSPMAPRMNILTSPDKSDPLNLKTFIGWKAFYGAKALITNVADDVPHFLLFRTKTTFA
jgi:N4-gp56 family major capsid protein